MPIRLRSVRGICGSLTTNERAKGSTKGEVDRIGERIRAHNGRIPDSDLPALQAWRRRHEHVVQKAVSVMRAIGFEPTPRVKTLNTLVEKLVREQSMKLSRVQDIAGVRIVVEGQLRTQDAVGDAIRAAFPDNPRTVDRRTGPSHGYRALHVVVRLDGCLVEVQIRTVLQHGWAEAYERLADQFGRGIRYGEPPVIPQARTVVEGMQEFSRMLREYEERWGDLEELADHVDELDLDDSEEAQGFRAALMDVRADRARLRRAIEALAEDFAEPVTQRVERRTTTD